GLYGCKGYNYLLIGCAALPRKYWVVALPFAVAFAEAFRSALLRIVTRDIKHVFRRICRHRPHMERCVVDRSGKNIRVREGIVIIPIDTIHPEIALSCHAACRG